MLPRRRPRGSLHDGISLDFATGRYYTKAQGGPVNYQPLTSLFTFTGGNQSMYMGPAGLLVASVTNTPRIEYDASGNCKGLLLEAARTNLALQSQDLATTWTVTRATISANSISAPDGTTTADKVVEDSTAANSHFASQNITFTSGTTYTASIYLKAAERTFCFLAFGAAAFTSQTGAYFNLSTGVVGTLVNAPTASIQAVGNGWYRCTIAKAATVSTAAGLQVHVASADNTASYNGDGSSGIYAWGAQCEAGAFPSSYIPTTTVSVARTADRCIRTLSTEFSATAGTFVVIGDMDNSVGATPAIFAAHNNAGTGAEEMILYANAGARRWLVTDNGVAQGNVLGGSITDGARGKMACVYAVNDLDLAVNGVMSGLQDTSATLPTITHLDLMRQDASAISVGHILKLDYWPTRLSNGELVRLSS